MLVPLIRVCAGILSGSIFGLFTDVLIHVWNVSDGETHIPILGPVIGGACGGLVGGLLGQHKIAGWSKAFALAIVLGALTGALIGYFVYAPFAAAVDPFARDIFLEKTQAQYQRVGLFWGSLLGAVCVFGLALI